MDQVQQRILIVPRGAILAAAGLLIMGASEPAVKRFYPDDPLWKMPPAQPVKDPQIRKVNYLYDFVVDSVATPGAKRTPGALIRALDVNTLGEAPDSMWYTNRHYWNPMTIEQLQRGPAQGNEPVPPFIVVAAKTEGITPGFQMRDARGRRYFCKPDPPSNPEMATAADVIGSKFFYAFGYNVPENYITYFTRREISVDPKRVDQEVLDRVLRRMPRDREDRYRIVASFQIPGKGVGPFRWYNTRTDDPNDIYAHEHRRTLRGLYVFCAWLNHTDVKSGNTYDSLEVENEIPVLRHYLIDFGSMLGSDSDEPKNARFGHEYMIEKDAKVLGKVVGLGLYSPDWERAKFPHIPAAAHFEAATFHPDRWTSNYPVAAFLNRLPDDEFWAAKQVVNFSNEQIRAMVSVGNYSDTGALNYITETLKQRRDKIGRELLTKVLPLDRFSVRDGQLVFEDLAAKHGFAPPQSYRIQWYSFDNRTGQRTLLPGATGASAPNGGEYTMAEIRVSAENPKTVSVYLRGTSVVGIDRTW